MRRFRLVALAAILLALAVFLALLVLPRLTGLNQSAVHRLRLSPLGASLFWWRMGYWPALRRATVVWTDTPQTGYRLRDRAGLETVSFATRRQPGQVTVYIHYPAATYAATAARPGWLERDVYIGLCLAAEGNTLGWQGCRQKAADYYHWRQARRLPGSLARPPLGFSLVTPAYAGCSGTIACGTEDWVSVCSGGPEDGETCIENNDCINYSCVSGWDCLIDQGEVKNCYTIDADECNLADPASLCDDYCNISNDTCTWYDTPPPPESDVPPAADL
jgi:hypothetical protein